MKNEVKPIAMLGIHQAFFKYFLKQTQEKLDIKVLEAGAGHGAFSKKLYDKGYDVSACDLYPELFMLDQVPFKQADLTQEIPYESDSFDIVVAIEVMEHIFDHERFFRECHRVLKPGGRLLISTPNILSLKSRLSFLVSGFLYSFKQLDPYNNDGLQHVASLTLDQYNYLGIRYGFTIIDVDKDKNQNTSILFMFLYPLIFLFCKLYKVRLDVHNTVNLLLSRILFINFLK